MRSSLHCSRKEGSAKHNDRSFLDSMTEDEKKAYQEKTGHDLDIKKNYYEQNWWIIDDGTKFCHEDGYMIDFDRVEKEYYQSEFSEWLTSQNEKHIKSRHPERCKTMDDILKSKNYKPEEFILQIGNKDDHVSDDLFRECYNEFLWWLEAWNLDHNEPFNILNSACHFDESTPHAHFRRVWSIEKDGVRIPGNQDKALEMAGIPLPDPSKPKGRYNNRKMTFDAMCRDKWHEIIKSHGIEIETEPLKNGKKHKELRDYISDQQTEALKKIDDLTEKIEEKKKDLNTVSNELNQIRSMLERQKSELLEQIEKKKQVQAELQQLTDKEVIHNLFELYRDCETAQEWNYDRNSNVSFDTLEEALDVSFNRNGEKFIDYDLEQLEKALGCDRAWEIGEITLEEAETAVRKRKGLVR